MSRIPSGLHAISDAEWESLSAGLPRTKLAPDEAEDVREATARAASGQKFLPARCRANLTPGDVLKTVRELQEMTQNDLARASGIQQTAIMAMECGRLTIGADRARKLAKALRVHAKIIPVRGRI